MFCATVRHRRVKVSGTNEKALYRNCFYGDGWDAVMESQHLEAGKRIVFTNLGGNTVGLIPFAHNGLGLGFEHIPRTTLNKAVPIIRGPLDKGEFFVILILFMK